MEPSKGSRKILSSAIIAVVVVCLSGITSGNLIYRYYYREYNDIVRAVESEGYEVEKKWLYSEDLRLEEFGVFISKGNLQFWIDIRFLSNVRSADSLIEGFILQSIDENRDTQNRVYRIDSEFWTDYEAYRIQTVSDFLRHAEQILPKLLDSKSQMQAKKNINGSREYQNYLIIRDDPDHVAPVSSAFIYNNK